MMISWSRMGRALVGAALVTTIALACLAGAAFANEADTAGTPQAAEPAPAPAPAAAERGSATKANLPEGGRWLATIAARVLGMNAQDVREARRAGKSIAQIASQRGMSEKELTESVMKRVDERLNTLVSKGTLSEEQSDRVRSVMRARLKALLNRTDEGVRERGRGGEAPGRAARRVFLKGYQQGWKQGFKCGIEMRTRLGDRVRKVRP